MLPALDTDYLQARGLAHEVRVADGITSVLLPNWPLPAGYTLPQATLLLRLSAGYPDVQPDMWWFNPPVVRTDGRPIPATEATEHHFGQQWQRWSRHLSAGQWHAGIDGLESYLALVRKELERGCLGLAV
jgi:hypothetical protein